MSIQQLPDSVHVIDAQYITHHSTSVYLLEENGRAAFVDANTNHSVPHLLAGLEQAGLTPDAVDYIIITHVHLDHAGGTGELLKHCPNATVLAHPKAARHLADPSRLIQGSKMVYGEALFNDLYGEILPVDPDRMRSMQDGEELAWGSRTFKFIYTLGHATHHFVIFDKKHNVIFTGDAMGIGRSEFVRPGPHYCVASSSPPEFDPDGARKAAADILATGADIACIAHYGPIYDVPLAAEQFLRSVDRMEAIALEAAASSLEDSALNSYCAERVGEAFDELLRECRVQDFDSDRAAIQGDEMLNGMGAAILAQRKRKGK